MEYVIEIYQTSHKRLPFNDWLEDLDLEPKNKIKIQLRKLSLGNFGNCKSLGEGVIELKIDFGPGYRIYYGLAGTRTILILCAGSKRTQTKDILKAKDYLKSYKMWEKNHGKK